MALPARGGSVPGPHPTKPPSPHGAARAASGRTWAATLLLLLALHSAPLAAAGGYYCCLSGEQQKVCGSPLPPACHGRAFREFNERGVLIRDAAAPLTPQQQAQQAEAEARRRERAAAEAAAAAELRRQDTALLNTYAGLEDIDRVRERAEKEIQRAVLQAEQKLAQLRKEQQRWLAEAEFYQKKAMPAEISKGLQATATDISAQEADIAARQQELAGLLARFEGEKQRYQEVLQRRGVLVRQAPSSSSPPGPAVPRPH